VSGGRRETSPSFTGNILMVRDIKSLLRKNQSTSGSKKSIGRNTGQLISSSPRSPKKDTKLDKRITEYVAEIPSAIDGQGGHSQTYTVACILTWGFALSEAQAVPYFETYNARCEPPWDREDLLHKLADSIKDTTHKKPRGYLLNDDPVNEFDGLNEDEVKQHFDEVYLRTPSGDFPAPARKEAFYGIAGKIVKIATDNSELRPEAVLAQFLTAFGNMLGRGLYKYQESRHGTNINVGIIGTTADGAKGGSWRTVKNLIRSVGPNYSERISGGHQSGEAIIEDICDEVQGKNSEGETITITPEQPDKRLLLVEEELSRIFRVQGRGGSIITHILRQCYDSPDVLAAKSRQSQLKSTGAHVSLIGHITPEELKSSMNNVEVYNGFANRIIWIASERTQDIPEPKWVRWDTEQAGIVCELRSVLTAFAKKTEWEFNFSDEGREEWIKAYYAFNAASRGKSGLMGALLARAKPNVLRLSLIYAALDRCDKIEPEHIAAARAVWDYSVESARWGFGNNSGNRIADVILSALKRAKGKGLTKTYIANDVLRKGTGGGEIDDALSALKQNGQADFRVEKGKGRPSVSWFAI
jgi:hypothetical protein